MGNTKTIYRLHFFRIICLALLILAIVPQPAMAAGTCGTGTWTAGNLEIHHINIGQGDAALIVGPTGKSLLFDAGESNWNSSAKAQIIGPYIEGVLGCKSLDYVLISHFHLDHIGYVGYGGLWNLVEAQGFSVGTTLVRNYNTYLGDTSSTFTNWKIYLEGTGQAKLHPVTAIEGTSQVDLGAGVTFDIVTVDGNGAIIAGDFHADASAPSENDYSIGAVLSYGAFDEWIGGDVDGQYATGFGYTYHDIELSVAPEVGDVDVYKANHHGSSHSSSATFINQLDPEVSIVTVGNGNSYGHPTQETIDRLLATSTVYMTERGETTTNIGSAIVAGNIVIKTSNGSTYTVNGTPYTATEPTRTDIDGDGYFVEADPNDNNSGTVPAPNGGCDSNYQTCAISCQVTPGQVLINEVLPSPSAGSEWVELYNATANTINIGYCYVDDIVGGSVAYQIPASTLIPSHGFWTLDRTTYFNNTGDDVRFLKEDATTLLDSFTYGNTGSNLSWYRLPDGGNWVGVPTASTTKGQSNTIPFYPIVSSIVRTDDNPTNLDSVNFIVSFSKPVTGINTSVPFSDFALTTTGVTGAYISALSGSGASYTVTVNTGSGSGTIGLDVVDDDSVRDGSNNPLGGNGIGNGNYAGDQIYTIIRNAPSFNPDTTGVFRPSNGALYLKNMNTTGFADVQINYGLGGDYPVVGDWDGNGTVTIGIYRNGSFYLRNENTIGFADAVFPFGAPGDQPIAGDWNGDGVDTIGVYRSSTGTFFLRNNNSAGAPEMTFSLGIPGDVGIAGDWNADGMDTTGVFRPSNGALYLKNTNTTGFADIQINYGLPGDFPVVGDWDGDGDATIGIYRNGSFYLRNSNTVGFADIVFALGVPGDMPIAGDWDGMP
jgi:beta-lactamase superfamily II metal-dependent hydrolase